MEAISLQSEANDVIVGERVLLVKVTGGALHPVGLGSTAAGDEVDHTIDVVAFVVVDVAGADQDFGMQLRRDFAEVVAEGDLVGARIVADLDMLLDVGNRRVVHGENDEIDGWRQAFQLCVDPACLIAAGKEGGVAVKGDEVDAGAELGGVPAAVAELGEGVPPVLQALLGVAVKFVVAEGGKDVEIGGAPGFGFDFVDGVVIFVAAGERNVAIQDDGGRFFDGDFADEILADAGIGGFRVVRVGEALVAVDNEAEGRAQVGVGELEGGAGLAEELVRGNGGGVGVDDLGLGC